MTEEAEQAAAPGDIDAEARWQTTRAKLLARHGQFTAAQQLADQAEALISQTSWAALQAEMLVAKAEVARLAGARNDAERHLRHCGSTRTGRQHHLPSKPRPSSPAWPANPALGRPDPRRQRASVLQADLVVVLAARLKRQLRQDKSPWQSTHLGAEGSGQITAASE